MNNQKPAPQKPINKSPEKWDPNMNANPASTASTIPQKAPGLISQELWNLYLIKKKAKNKIRTKR